jgi:Fringe-like
LERGQDHQDEVSALLVRPPRARMCHLREGRGHLLCKRQSSLRRVVKSYNCDKLLFDSLQGNPLRLDKVLFAVKTCEKYHKERLPIILRSWAQFTIHLRIFSDVRDDAIPTISTQIPNTERGHCEKSLKILRLVLDEIMRNSTLKSVEWIVMADDDTLLR